jgi:uncharacterized protein (TIGR03067 family)
MTKWRIPILLVVGLLLAADSGEDAVKKEKQQLVGTWTVVSLEVNGQKVPAEALKDFQFIFTADSLTRKKGGKAESGAGYKLDPSRSPKWIDMTGITDGKEQAIPGVYKLDGDTLTLCFRADYKKKDGKPNEAQKRPEKLDGGAGSEQVLMVLSREKP